MIDKGTVLVVQHHDVLRDINRECLEAEGHTVHTADSAGQARAILAELEPDVVLLDVDLPDCDGFAFSRELWETTASRIILITSGSERDDNLYSILSGADAYFPKPYRLDEILRSVEMRVREGKYPHPREKLLPYPAEVKGCEG